MENSRSNSSVCPPPLPLLRVSPSPPPPLPPRHGVGFQGLWEGLFTYTHVTEANAWNPTVMLLSCSLNVKAQTPDTGTCETISHWSSKVRKRLRKERLVSRARFRAHGFRAPAGLGCQLSSEVPAEGWGAGRACRRKPTTALVKTEEGNRLIPREIRVQELGTERFMSAVSCPGSSLSAFEGAPSAHRMSPTSLEGRRWWAWRSLEGPGVKRRDPEEYTANVLPLDSVVHP